MSKMLKVVGASWLQTKVSFYILGTLGALAILALFIDIDRTEDDGNYAATVYWSQESGFRIEFWGQSNELSTVPKGAARAYYGLDIDTSGWSQLEIETDESYPDWIQAFAAGMVEGALTWQAVYAHVTNTADAPCAAARDDCDRLREALTQATVNVKQNIAKYEETDPFWHQVSLFYMQLDGMLYGWKHGVDRSRKDYEIEMADLYWLNAMSEIKEIKKHLGITLNETVLDVLPGMSSALLKIVNETIEIGNNKTNIKKKLFVAHNTFGSYNSMVRILKRYKLNYHLTAATDAPLVPGTTTEFSSYPAALTSHDDMYVISGSGNDHLMAVTGTTINNFNEDLWKKVNINYQVPIGPRMAAVNRLATNVSSWGHTLASTNSGTACKQWMVVDFSLLANKLENKTDDANEEPSKSARSETADTLTYVTVDGKNKDIKHTVLHRVTPSNRLKGLFWLIEQVPGHAHSGDLSDALLEKGYWATYGIPFFKDIAEVTQTIQREQMYGKMYSYNDSPRAATFRHHSKNVSSINSILNLMRSNNLTSFQNIIDVKKPLDSTENTDVGSREKCSEKDSVDEKINCLLNDKAYWATLGVRGDLPEQNKQSYGVIDTKVFSGNADCKIQDFAALSGPTYTHMRRIKSSNDSKEKINKGNVATSTQKSKADHAFVNNILIENLVIDPNEVADPTTINIIPPFQWSTSDFSNESHTGQPDTWEFEPYNPVWVW